MQLLAQTEGVPLIARSIGIVRTHNPLEGAEYFKEHAPEQFDVYNEAVYRAFWEKSQDISEIDILAGIAESAGVAPGDFADKVLAKAYKAKVVPYDDPAYAKNVFYVPTFRFRGEQCAEAPYSTVRDMMVRHLAHNAHES
jgi:predicted DsbA family dithiol-disulfide isomerase